MWVTNTRRSNANSKNFKKHSGNESVNPSILPNNTVETRDFSDKSLCAKDETADIVLERYNTFFRNYATMCTAVSFEPNTFFSEYKSLFLVIDPLIGLAIGLLGLSFVFFLDSKKNTK